MITHKDQRHNNRTSITQRVFVITKSGQSFIGGWEGCDDGGGEGEEGEEGDEGGRRVVDREWEGDC